MKIRNHFQNSPPFFVGGKKGVTWLKQVLIDRAKKRDDSPDTYKQSLFRISICRLLVKIISLDFIECPRQVGEETFVALDTRDRANSSSSSSRPPGPPPSLSTLSPAGWRHWVREGVTSTDWITTPASRHLFCALLACWEPEENKESQFTRISSCYESVDTREPKRL